VAKQFKEDYWKHGFEINVSNREYLCISENPTPVQE
jgi:hypothetical protein